MPAPKEITGISVALAGHGSQATAAPATGAAALSGRGSKATAAPATGAAALAGRGSKTTAAPATGAAALAGRGSKATAAPATGAAALAGRGSKFATVPAVAQTPMEPVASVVLCEHARSLTQTVIVEEYYAQRLETIIDIITDHPKSGRCPARDGIDKAIIVCRSKMEADIMLEHLRKKSIRCAASTGGETLYSRSKAMWNLRRMPCFKLTVTKAGFQQLIDEHER